VAEVVAREAAGQPEAVRQALTAYLNQVPNAIRQSQRRPEDPSGRSVSARLSLRRKEDLQAILPPRGPRFKKGDRPPGIGDWELEELLGMGGFGEVWKARNPFTQDTVALKFCLDTEAAKVLRNEAVLLGRVQTHGKLPRIVRLLDTHLGVDPPCLKYEYVAGGDLAGLVYELLQRNKGKLPPNMARNITLSLARAMMRAHQLKPHIVHRDLKPANILVQRREPGKIELHITDFGIGGVAANQAIEHAQEASTGHFEATALRGAHTPLYASPQQTEGAAPDPRDDVFALGVIWYQMLVGDLSRGAPRGMGWMKPFREQGMAPAELELLQSCFDDDPESRPDDAGALAQRIEQLAKPVPIPPASPPAAGPDTTTKAVGPDPGKPPAALRPEEPPRRPEAVPPASSPMLHCRTKGLVAQGYETAKGFVVQAGGQAVRDSSPSVSEQIATLRANLLRDGILVPEGDHLKLTRDYLFTSSSSAACTLAGGGRSGPVSWKDAQGRTLRELQSPSQPTQPAAGVEPPPAEPSTTRWRQLWQEASADSAWVAHNKELDAKRTKVRGEVADFLGRYLGGKVGTEELRATFDRRTRTDWEGFGFKGMSGAMFLNKLVKYLGDGPKLAAALRSVLRLPKGEEEGRTQMRAFLNFLDGEIKAGHVEKVQVQPARAPFFISCWWHIQNAERWPIFYLSDRKVLELEGLFTPTQDRVQDYFAFRQCHLALAPSLGLTSWQLEYLCFWQYGRNAKQQPPHDRPERHDRRQRFWQALLARPKMKGTRHADIAPGVFSWIGAGSGVRGLPFVYAIQQGQGRVELYIDRGAGMAAENKELFDSLHQHKDEIEKAFSGLLSWQRLDDKQACRIAYEVTGGGWKTDESKWPQIQDAMIDAMARLEKALAPHLEKSKTEMPSEGT
jgi:serine/threonine protein kinase